MTLTVDDRELIERLREPTAIGYHARRDLFERQAADRLQSLLSERDKLEQRVRELEVALRPFAWHVGKSDEMVKLVIGKDCWTRTLFTDDFERARAALIQTEVP